MNQKGLSDMAVKQRNPTAAGREQIKRKFQNVFDEKLEFISAEQIKFWYGRHDSAAIGKLREAWLYHWESKDWKPPVAPKLFVVGPIFTPKKGWVVGRQDKQKNLLYELGD